MKISLNFVNFFRFNIPLVSAYLERVMGSSIVKPTDPDYIKKLHKNSLKVYKEMMEERSDEREVRKPLISRNESMEDFL